MTGLQSKLVTSFSLIALSFMPLSMAASVPAHRAITPTGDIKMACPHDAKPACPHQDCKKEGSISTQGHGEVKIKPDSLSFTISQTTQKAKLKDARDENNRQVQSIISALKALNVPGFKLESSNISIYPQREQVENNKRIAKVIGYQVIHSLKVSVYSAPADQLGEWGSKLIDSALNAGATETGGLNFFVADLAPARSVALGLAVKDAQRNADAMAAAANIQLDGLVSLDGSSQFSGYPVRPMMSRAMFKSEGADSTAETPVETGEVTITSDVSAKYRF
jgi:uncharacterized protein YggE